jgi:fermentation-respiration switch protein FrsA (DUF1100 family)
MLKLALGLVAFLVLLPVLVRLLEPRFAFFPTAGESVTPRAFGLDYRPFAVATGDGERLHGWLLTRADARARILYFHGNGGNLSVWAPILVTIAERGYSIAAFDYRGYGMSSGSPTEHGLYRDVDAVVERWWQDSNPGAPVVYWGRSLGTVMAAYAATVRAPDGLILEAGFPDARSFIRSSPLLTFLGMFSTYRFPSVEFLGRIERQTPTLVMHGDQDQVVPFGQGRALFDRIGEPKQFVTIRGGDHNDLTPPDPTTYWRAVDLFVNSLDRTP